MNLTFDTSANYLLTIELHPKVANKLNTLDYKLYSQHFEDLSPLFEWCQRHNVAVK